MKNFTFWYEQGWSYLRSRVQGVEEMIFALHDESHDCHDHDPYGIMNRQHGINMDKLEEAKKEILEFIHDEGKYVDDPAPIWKDATTITIVLTDEELAEAVRASNRVKAVFLGDNLFQKKLFDCNGNPVLLNPRKVGLAGIFNLIIVPEVKVIYFQDQVESGGLASKLRIGKISNSMCQEGYNASYIYTLEQEEKTIFTEVGWGSVLNSRILHSDGFQERRQEKMKNGEVVN